MFGWFAIAATACELDVDATKLSTERVSYREARIWQERARTWEPALAACLAGAPAVAATVQLKLQGGVEVAADGSISRHEKLEPLWVVGDAAPLVRHLQPCLADALAELTCETDGAPVRLSVGVFARFDPKE